jgi:hypothetical protein
MASQRNRGPHPGQVYLDHAFPERALERDLDGRVDDELPSLPALPGVLTRTSYELPDGLDFDKWETAVVALLSMVRSVSWWLGDALRYGEARYGEMYAQAVEMTGLEYQTLKNAVWMCSHVEKSRRRDRLSFSHHTEVAGLDPEDQDRLLDQADAEGWTRSDIRAARRRLRGGTEVEQVERAVCACCGQRMPNATRPPARGGPSLHPSSPSSPKSGGRSRL